MEETKRGFTEKQIAWLKVAKSYDLTKVRRKVDTTTYNKIEGKWKQIQKEKYTTEWFGKEELPTKAVQERLTNLPSVATRL